MAMGLKSSTLVLLFISFSSFLLPALSKIPSGGIDTWCNKTPHPNQCKYFFSHHRSRHVHVPKHKSDFRKMAVRLALDVAVRAETDTKELGYKCRTKPQKVAWTDCVKLYRATVEQLNRTANPNVNYTEFDKQTWLSAALTNLETCRTGFAELGVPDFVQPVSSNVSKLIGNTLALGDNKATHESSSYTKDGFPTWLSPGDRKLLQSSTVSPDLVVAQDGSGDYRTISDALEAAAARSGGGRFVIYVKSGVYEENLEISSSLKNIMLYSDSMRYTYITGNLSVGGGSTTFNSATVVVNGDGFIARGITFRNTAGPENHQAVALRSSADHSVFYRCGFEGYQDTLYVHSERQFYKECYIYGTVDFIFGNAAVVLQNCIILARRPMDKQKITITAQGRKDPNQNTGISIHQCVVKAAADLVPVLGSFRTFLGRPWKEYSRTVFMQSYLDSLVDPAGWLEWDGNFALDTLYYGEYNNFGPGSDTSGRVSWKGYRVITDATEAEMFVVANLIGDSWLSATGVPYKPGL